MGAVLSGAARLGGWAKAASYCGSVKLVATPLDYQGDVLGSALATQVAGVEGGAVLGSALATQVAGVEGVEILG